MPGGGAARVDRGLCYDLFPQHCLIAIRGCRSGRGLLVISEPEGETPSGPPLGEDRERAGLIGDCAMTCFPTLALSPQGGATAAGHQPRERLRRGVRSVVQLPGGGAGRVDRVLCHVLSLSTGPIATGGCRSGRGLLVISEPEGETPSGPPPCEDRRRAGLIQILSNVSRRGTKKHVPIT